MNFEISKPNVESTALTVGTSSVKVSTSTTALGDLLITSLSTNTAPIYIGGAGVTTANGFPIAIGQTISVGSDAVNTLWAVSSSAAQVFRILRSF